MKNMFMFMCCAWLINGCSTTSEKASPKRFIIRENHMLMHGDRITHTLHVNGVVLQELPKTIKLRDPMDANLIINGKKLPPIMKHPEMPVGRWQGAAHLVQVALRPGIDPDGKVKLTVFRILWKNPQWQIENTPVELTSADESDVTVFCVTNDGEIWNEVVPEWRMLVLFVGCKGIICWNEVENDAIISPYTSGFRYFSIIEIGR